MLQCPFLRISTGRKALNGPVLGSAGWSCDPSEGRDASTGHPGTLTFPSCTTVLGRDLSGQRTLSRAAPSSVSAAVIISQLCGNLLTRRHPCPGGSPPGRTLSSALAHCHLVV